MKTLKVFKTKADIDNFYSGQRIPSGVLVMTEDEQYVTFTTNNVDGTFKRYEGTLTSTEYTADTPSEDDQDPDDDDEDDGKIRGKVRPMEVGEILLIASNIYGEGVEEITCNPSEGSVTHDNDGVWYFQKGGESGNADLTIKTYDNVMSNASININAFEELELPRATFGSTLFYADGMFDEYEGDHKVSFPFGAVSIGENVFNGGYYYGKYIFDFTGVDIDNISGQFMARPSTNKCEIIVPSEHLSEFETKFGNSFVVHS